MPFCLGSMPVGSCWVYTKYSQSPISKCTWSLYRAVELFLRNQRHQAQTKHLDLVESGVPQSGLLNLVWDIV